VEGFAIRSLRTFDKDERACADCTSFIHTMMKVGTESLLSICSGYNMYQTNQSKSHGYASGFWNWTMAQSRFVKHSEISQYGPNKH
jgi:hypothetical protein